MGKRILVCSLLVLALVLLPASPALANGLASWVMVWPGAASVDPLFGLLPTVLVAFVERPFVSRAGIRQRPLIRSLRANLLSLLAGIPVALFVWSVRSETDLLLLTLGAVLVTIVVEIAYFRSVQRKEAGEFRAGWIILGNIVSNLLLIGIALLVRTLQTTHPHLGLALEPYYLPLGLAHFAISATMVTAALAEPVVRFLRQPFLIPQSEPTAVPPPADRTAADPPSSLPVEPITVTGGAVEPAEVWLPRHLHG